MWEKCSILITCVRGLGLQLHTVSAPRNQIPYFTCHDRLDRCFKTASPVQLNAETELVASLNCCGFKLTVNYFVKLNRF